MWLDNSGWTRYTDEERAEILARTGEFYDRVVEQDDAITIANRRALLAAEDEPALKVLRRIYNGEAA